MAETRTKTPTRAAAKATKKTPAKGPLSHTAAARTVTSEDEIPPEGTMSAPAAAAHVQNNPGSDEQAANPLAASVALRDKERQGHEQDDPKMTESEFRSDEPGVGPLPTVQVVPEHGPSVKEMLKRTYDNTGLSREQLLDRLIIGAYSEGSLPSRDELLRG